MKFLCVRCQAPMRYESREGPEEGSLAVTFRCPQCDQQIQMITNQGETQLVQSLGIEIGGRTVPQEPMEMVRTHLATGSGIAGAEIDMSKCPFTQAIADEAEKDAAAPTQEVVITWTASAEARLQRLPDLVRPMAKMGIEEFARSQGLQTITPTLLDEAREKMDM